MKRKTQGKKDGSALLIAIIIMTVVMMLSLALLLVSFNLYATASRQQNMAQCKELAQSLSRALESEITIPPFESYTEQKEALESGSYPLWFYLRYNVGQSNWPYFNDERKHTAEYAHRYFQIIPSATGTEAAKLMDDISIMMYWESETGQEENGVPLVVQVSCEKGGQKSVITVTYELIIGSQDYDDAETGVRPNSASNPSLNELKYPEKAWSWAVNSVE
ncbi:hypothetical protein MCG98_10825 [Ruminococcus sp. OA3]|uniref:hypothetical protein n=1 Tax=Ruminococcus sp. OA3 TaxID=2914164 RepID=UPI001F067812|nr:hypothetical protein [Ruminococcus sp. OA3]MCH1983058.1 hypothetical protein [Ruminococcus sp. OA3]